VFFFFTPFVKNRKIIKRFSYILTERVAN